MKKIIYVHDMINLKNYFMVNKKNQMLIKN
jgi:hypothetical protein